MRWLATALLCSSCWAKPSELEGALQGLVDGLARKYGYAMQMAWRSDTEDFTVAAGRHASYGKARD